METLSKEDSWKLKVVDLLARSSMMFKKYSIDMDNISKELYNLASIPLSEFDKVENIKISEIATITQKEAEEETHKSYFN